MYIFFFFKLPVKMYNFYSLLLLMIQFNSPEPLQKWIKIKQPFFFFFNITIYIPSAMLCTLVSNCPCTGYARYGTGMSIMCQQRSNRKKEVDCTEAGSQ